MGLILRSWPLGIMSPSVRGGDDTGVPSALTSAGDAGIRRGLSASDPWTEPAHTVSTAMRLARHRCSCCYYIQHVRAGGASLATMLLIVTSLQGDRTGQGDHSHMLLHARTACDRTGCVSATACDRIRVTTSLRRASLREQTLTPP